MYLPYVDRDSNYRMVVLPTNPAHICAFMSARTGVLRQQRRCANAIDEHLDLGLLKEEDYD